MNIKRILALFLMILAISVLLAGSVSAKDEWTNVRSKNFNLVGNASDKEIRKVATRLEQFRETFRLLFDNLDLNSSIPTNVVVFKSDSAYKPFKPKRADGKADNFIAGYFMPGDDVNYITLSTGGVDADNYGTIFHEYVHFIVNMNFGKSEVPPWFNEGLAEFYSTFEIVDDIKVKLGLPQINHLNLLAKNKLIPLNTFFNISNSALHQNGDHSRSIFYAQAWAIIHYLITNQKSEGLRKFLGLSMKNVAEEKAFQDSFQMTYAQMEKELRQYVTKATYQYSTYILKDKLTFDAEMRSMPLPEADADAYLGDLLYHSNRPDDAEPLLMAALALDADSVMANTALGVVKIRQRKFEDAKSYLAKAISKDPKNHLAYYQYAYLLSREGRDEFGYVNSFPPEKTAKMRELLKKAIEINPSFTESYEMLAFIALVGNDGIDDGIAAMQTALRLRPGNQRYAMRMAELYTRQEKFDQAQAIAEKISKTSDEPRLKSQADNLIEQIAEHRNIAARNDEARKKYEAAIAAGAKAGGMVPILIRRGADGKGPTPDEMAKSEEEFTIRAINRELRKAGPEEVRVLGTIDNIDCKGGTVAYAIKAEGESFMLTSKDFQGVNLNTYVTEGGDAEVGCDAKVSAKTAVLIYKHKPEAKGPGRGELISIEFVPTGFRFVETAVDDSATAPSGETMVSEGSDSPSPPSQIGTGMPSKEDFDAERRNAMMSQIRGSLRKPNAGEKQELVFIEKSECTNKGAFFFFKTPTQLLKLSNSPATKLQLRAYVPDAAHIPVGCAMKAVEIPVVITYTDAPDKKTKTNGELISLEFVPNSFVLQ